MLACQSELSQLKLRNGAESKSCLRHASARVAAALFATSIGVLCPLADGWSAGDRSGREWKRDAVAQSDGVAEEADLVSLVLDLLGNSNPQIRALAFEQISEGVPGEGATRMFAKHLDTLPPKGQIGLLAALRHRGDAAARAAVIEQLSNRDVEVRVAAVRTLGTLGKGSDVPRLIPFLTHESQEMQNAGQAALVQLAARDVAGALVREMKNADVTMGGLLIEILIERRSREAMPLLMYASLCDDPVLRRHALIGLAKTGGSTGAIVRRMTLADAVACAELFQILVERCAAEATPILLFAAICDNPDLRRAAMQALAELGGPGEIPGMVRGVLAAGPGSERELAERAIASVCRRIEEGGSGAVPLLRVMAEANVADRRVLLPVLGRVGGPQALETVEGALGEASTHAAAVRALCNWPTADVAPRLLQLAQGDFPAETRIAALRALIRVAPLPDHRSDEERLALLALAVELSTRDEERRLALERASAIRTVESLRFALDYLDCAEFSEQACETIVDLAHHRWLRYAHQGEFHEALNRVLETSDDETNRERATRYLRGETWVRPQ